MTPPNEEEIEIAKKIARIACAIHGRDVYSVTVMNETVQALHDYGNKRSEEGHPTQWAYDQACKALEEWKKKFEISRFMFIELAKTFLNKIDPKPYVQEKKSVEWFDTELERRMKEND